MQQAFEFFFASWPLLVVAILAFVMIRASRGGKRHDVRSGGDHSSGTTGGGRRFDTDHSGGGDNGGGGGGD